MPFLRFEFNLNAVSTVSYFILCLCPYSIGGVSVNYIFWLMPLVVSVVGGQQIKLSNIIAAILFVYLTIFIISSVTQVEFYQYFDRRLASFIIFIGMFSLCYIKISDNMMIKFKYALIIFGILFSVIALYKNFILEYGLTKLGGGAKDAIGSQRIGFIYLLGISILFDLQPINKIKIFIKYLLLIVLLLGLFLTFSRSSIFGLICLITARQATLLIKVYQQPINEVIIAFIKNLVGIIVLGLLICLFIPDVVLFYKQVIFNYATDVATISQDLNNVNTSGGARVYLIKTILDYVVTQPLTGTGFLGVWVIPDIQLNSAHNQYLDVLLRTGVLGCCAYCYLLWIICRYLYENEYDLFCGFIGVLCIGLFHETFKESQGSFIFAFLMARAVGFQVSRFNGLYISRFFGRWLSS